MRDEEHAWLRLALTPGIGPRITLRLLDLLGDVGRVVAAGQGDFVEAAGRKRGAALHRALQGVRCDALLRECARLDQRVLTRASPGWPEEAFAALDDAPLVLYARGRLPREDEPTVAVVGTREAGAYGLRVARELAEDLARAGVWVISGMALGVDGAAHEGAMVGDRGATLAVLGCGLDIAYPPQHLALRDAIAEAGGLLSELPPGTRPSAGQFPRRNRIVAALAHAVVVVEAPRQSGALLTARRALELGREILVVPGPVGRYTFRGSHQLLKQGEAVLCEDAADVLVALGRDPAVDAETAGPRRGTRTKPALPPSGPPLALWGVLGDDETLDADELCRRTGLAPSDVGVGIAQLEIDGRIVRVPGVGVRRA